MTGSEDKFDLEKVVKAIEIESSVLNQPADSKWL
jgi:hypothetical protein